MKLKPNPYIQCYKKLHREKVERKTTSKRSSNTYCRTSKTVDAICRIACEYGVSTRFLFAVYEEIKSILNKRVDEVEK